MFTTVFPASLQKASISSAVIAASANYPDQLALIHSDADVIATNGTRRSGKTTGCLRRIVARAPRGELFAVVGQSATKAMTVLLPKLRELEADAGLEWKPNHNTHRIELSTGATLACFGITSNKDIDNIRSDRYSGALIVETGTLPEERLQLTVDEALEPALSDLAGIGGIGLMYDGTPSPLFDGYWHKLTLGKEKEAEPHFFDILRNPMYRGGRAEAYLAGVLRKNKWTPETPQYLREYRGKFCISTIGACVPSLPKQILPQHLAPRQGRVIIGLDPGLKDPCAFIVLVVIDNEIHLVHAEEESGLTLPKIAARLRVLMSEHNTGESYGDAYGMGAGYIETLASSYGIPIVPCPYSDKKKAPRIDFLEGICASGNLYVYEGARDFVDQVRLLVWDSKRQHPVKGFLDHIFDAVLAGVDGLYQNHEHDTEPTPEELAAEERRRQIAIQSGDYYSY